MKKLYLVVILITIVVCSALAAPLLIQLLNPPSDIDKAIEFMAKTNEPYALLMNNVIYRQFGVAQFSDSLRKYDQIIADKPDSTLKLFRRIAAFDNPVADSYFNSVHHDIDKITIPALYSDRRALPANYSEMLQEGLKGGEYLTTHTLLATIWLKENNCSVALPSNFMNALYEANAAIIENGTELTDLKIEAAALLYQAGQGQMVNSSFVDLVRVNQNADGGWPPTSNFNPKDSYWHTTALALLLLLNVERPTATYRPWLATPQTSQNHTAANLLELLPLAACMLLPPAIKPKRYQAFFNACKPCTLTTKFCSILQITYPRQPN